MNKLKKINPGMCVRICTENNFAKARNSIKYLKDVIELKLPLSKYIIFYSLKKKLIALRMFKIFHNSKRPFLPEFDL